MHGLIEFLLILVVAGRIYVKHWLQRSVNVDFDAKFLQYSFSGQWQSDSMLTVPPKMSLLECSRLRLMTAGILPGGEERSVKGVKVMKQGD